MIKSSYRMFLVLCCIYAGIICMSVSYKKSNTIPKIIWTYWDNNIPHVTEKIINDWKYLNPTWTVNIITRDTLSLYVQASELPKGFHNELDSPQASSDLIRLILLYKYGGVWLDANIILLKSLDWIQDIKHVEYIGYQMPSFTTNIKYPVIESWFMASKPKTNFIKQVRNEMYHALGRRTAYTKALLDTVDFQNIPKGLHMYLTIHVAIQKVLQTNTYDMRLFHLISAYKDAFALHGRFQWDSYKVVDYIKSIAFTENKDNFNLIKIRNDERKLF